MQNYFQILRQLYVMKNYFDLQDRNTNTQILQVSKLLILRCGKFFRRLLVSERIFLIEMLNAFLHLLYICTFVFRCASFFFFLLISLFLGKEGSLLHVSQAI